MSMDDHVSLEDIKLYLSNGFPWHSSEVPHKYFFRDKQWLKAQCNNRSFSLLVNLNKI